MKIYFAGTPGVLERERGWLRLLNKRLLSFWDLYKMQFGAPESFNMIKEINKDNK